MGTGSVGRVVETYELTRRFGGLVAVNCVNVSVYAGEIFGLIGPNGAGKSTLIKMLTTLLPPNEGTASVAGLDIVRQSAEVRRHIGYVPQLVSVDGALTGVENLLLSARLYSIPRREQRLRIEEVLAVMGLTEAAGHIVQRYSGGMIRRLEIALTILHQPVVLFMDEPTIGLDPVARHSVWKHVRKLRDQLQTTMLIATHYMEEVEQLCGRVALIDRGRIAEVGTPMALKAHLGPGATLDDLFERLTNAEIESERSFRDVRSTRRSTRARR